VEEIIVPSTSAQYKVSTIVHFPSCESHGRIPLPVQIITKSSALTPPIGYDSISLYVTRSCFLSVTLLFAPVSFCTVSVQIFNIMYFVGDISSIDGIVCMTLVNLIFVVVGGDSYKAGIDHVLFAV